MNKTGSSLEVTSNNMDGFGIYFCNSGFQLSRTSLRSLYGPDWETKTGHREWKDQHLKCVFDESLLKLKWVAEKSQVFDCEQIYCSKSSNPQISNESTGVSDLVPVGASVPYTCKDGRQYLTFCSESKQQHFTGEWTYPEGECVGINACS